ncbi:MAG TPA: BrnA antitoxin family protein [Chloroflexota bacterium]|nr:BrnA antitoxin family protein [Chloroflexota bacterium]
MSEGSLKKRSRTDWVRVDAMEDSDIDTSDIPELDESFFARARFRSVGRRVEVRLRLTPEVAEWYQRLGPDWHARMAAALRMYAEAHDAETAAD